MPTRLEAGPIAATAGAIFLLVSLFVDWYEPGVSAWTVFEVLDLVLAALALMSLAALAERFGLSPPGGAGAAPIGPGVVVVLGGLAVLLVLSQIINHPPAAVDSSTEVGIWLGLAGAVLLLGGGVLSVSRVSLAVNFDERPEDSPPAPDETPHAAPWDDERAESGIVARPSRASTDPRESPSAEARAAEPEVHDELYPEQERSGPIGADDPELGGPVARDSSEEEALVDEPEPIAEEPPRFADEREDSVDEPERYDTEPEGAETQPIDPGETVPFEADGEDDEPDERERRDQA